MRAVEKGDRARRVRSGRTSQGDNICTIHRVLKGCGKRWGRGRGRAACGGSKGRLLLGGKRRILRLDVPFSLEPALGKDSSLEDRGWHADECLLRWLVFSVERIEGGRSDST